MNAPLDPTRFSSPASHQLSPQQIEERRLLAGPQPRLKELMRAIRIFSECVHGFRNLHFVGPCVTVFGSARYKEDHPYYKLARDVGASLARAGFTVMTGGGPGIMEAANRGAKDVGRWSSSLIPTWMHSSSFAISSFAR